MIGRHPSALTMHWKTVFFIAVSISVILRVSCESEEEQSVDEPMEDQTGSQAREPDVDDDAGLPCHSFPFRKVIRQTGPNKGKEKYLPSPTAELAAKQ